MNLARKLKTLDNISFADPYLYDDGLCLMFHCYGGTDAHEAYSWLEENIKFRGRIWNLTQNKFE